ncbi:MAG: PUA domain-containing protein [Nitrososphaerales archaeon]
MKVYHLSKSARDELAENLTKILGGHQIKSKDLKTAESDDPNFTIVFDEKEKIYLGKKNDSCDYFPLLKDESILPSLPVVTVDSGAIKFVCNGANIMRPGISKIDGDFQGGGLLLVREQKYGKAIAIGRATTARLEMESATKGAVVTNLHYVGDKFWDMLKELPN